MEIKTHPNQEIYLQILHRMTTEQLLGKAELWNKLTEKANPIK